MVPVNDSIPCFAIYVGRRIPELRAPGQHQVLARFRVFSSQGYGGLQGHSHYHTFGWQGMKEFKRKWKLLYCFDLEMAISIHFFIPC